MTPKVISMHVKLVTTVKSGEIISSSIAEHGSGFDLIGQLLLVEKKPMKWLK